MLGRVGQGTWRDDREADCMLVMKRAAGALISTATKNERTPP